MAQADQTALQRRATWVGLRTLRQRPKVVGETRSGEPVFEVKSVRLVLREDAGHFNRLAECSKCGRDVPGAPMLTPADLDRPAHSVICKDCVRAAGVARPPSQPERRAAKPEAAPAEVEDKPPGPVEAAEDVRLAALEVQLQAAMSRLAELGDVDRAESAESRVQEALRQGLAEIRAEMSTMSERGGAESPVDEEARTRLDALTQVVQAQQGRLVSLSAVVDEVRAEVQRLAAWSQELARAQGDLERRIDDAVAQVGARTAALEKRLGGDVTDLGQAVEALRGDLEGPLGAPVAEGLAMVLQAIHELARSRDEIKADADARMEALGSAVEEGGSRVGDLEVRMDRAIDRLTAALEDHRRELKELGAAIPVPTDDADPATSEGSPAGDLLDGLERQLLRAQSRLARLTGGPGGGMAPTADG